MKKSDLKLAGVEKVYESERYSGFTIVPSGMTQDELYEFLGLEKPTDIQPTGTVTVTAIDRASGTITVSRKR